MFQRIEEAVARLKGVAHQTPVVTSRSLNQRFNCQLFMKCENFQRVGAFKFRGAYNAISQLTDGEKQAGILAYSSGNHAQAVAAVGQILELPTVIVMPENAPLIKRRATESYGAQVVYFDPEETTREVVAQGLIDKFGYTLIPPFNHVDIVAGQATAGYELVDAVEALDVLLVPCGGGGLLTGSAIAAKALNPNIKVYGIEPKAADDAARGFASGTMQTVHNPQTIADGTRTHSMGDITFKLMMENVDGIITVDEDSIKQAVALLFYRQKLVVEPSGALPIAALIENAQTKELDLSGRIGVVLSGGNIDGSTMSQILNEYPLL